MTKAIAPATEQDLAAAIAAGGPFAVEGSGSKHALGRPMASMPVLSLKRFSAVALYEPEELILEAGAATPLATIEALLAQKHQMLAFEPPDFSSLLGAHSAGTLGGLLAAGFAGPRRIKAGSVRDHVLGLRGVTGRGEIFKGGARVVKNVTGYDMPKMMAGSWGTLAALTSLTFKVLPAPETQCTLFIRGLTDDAAIAAMSAALQSPYEVSSAAHLPGQGTAIRIEGIPVSVKARAESLVKLLARNCDLLDDTHSANLWRLIRDVTALDATDSDIIWRVSVPPSDGAAFVQRISGHSSCKCLFDWGGGLLWLALPATAPDAHAAIVRGALQQGHAMLFRAPEQLRKSIPVFQPQPAPLAGLSARVKSAFDPLSKLNPGRMVEGI